MPGTTRGPQGARKASEMLSTVSCSFLLPVRPATEHVAASPPFPQQAAELTTARPQRTPTARNFTYTVEGDNWGWLPTDVCNQTVVSCIWTVPRDFRETGDYVVVAVREAAAALSASTATSGPFTIVASAGPTASATAAATGVRFPGSPGSPGSSGSSGSSGLPAETAVAPPAATEGGVISAGVAIVIACGAVIVLLASAGLLWLFCRRRKRKLDAAAARARAAGRSSGYEKPELDGQAVAAAAAAATAAENEPRVDIDGGPIRVAELDGWQTWEKDGAAAEVPKAEKRIVRVELSSAAELGAG
ncbi:hypothetical protein LX32DRAFT_701559 [Colletotrichum zoysiae]|uniref:Uncharacterized protein n=1 Tax=Colletotrichum zoysiae TaxID=1216348 RepID=A0AAD9M2H7_9PEZI|nr:hypothetical protein LX32DRAFT_701559 [Colletotrichum zoysiae]